MSNNKKAILLIGGIFLAGAVFYILKNRAFRKKYQVIEDRGFEIFVEKN